MRNQPQCHRSDKSQIDQAGEANTKTHKALVPTVGTVSGFLEKWILEGHKEWKVNVYGQCKSWLDSGLQPAP